MNTDSHTPAELEAEADALALASSLHTTGRDALLQIRGGALPGTLVALRLEQIYFLLDTEDSTDASKKAT